MDNSRRRFSIREQQAPSQLENTLQNPQYVDSLLNAASVSQFAQFSADLNQQQVQNQLDLQQTVSKSVDQVVHVASALQISKQSLDQLRPNVNALCELLHLQLEMAQLNVNKDQVGANRQSVMFLQSNWSASLKDLYLRIDGLIDILPYGNRRINYESKKWWEFNQTSDRAIRPLHIVVLSDCLVVAVRSKRQKKSKAIHRWPIDSLAITYNEEATTITLSAPNSVASFVLKTDKVGEFNTLADALKSSLLQKKKHNKRKSWQVSTQLDTVVTNRLSKDDLSSSLESIKAIEKDIDIIDDLLTSLSLSMSLKNYDSSVGFSKSLQQRLDQLTISHPQSLSQHVSILYEVKLNSFNSLRDQLVTNLADELAANIGSNLTKSKSLVELLSILGKNHLSYAQDYWLEEREKGLIHSVSTLRFGSSQSASIKKSTNLGHQKRESVMISSQTPQTTQATTFDGFGPINTVEEDANEEMAGQIILSYVRELCLIHVGICIRTWEEYNTVFESGAGTKVADWIITKMENLKNQLDNVLVDYERNSQVWIKSLQILKSVLNKLAEKGLDVSFVVGY